MSWTRTYIDCNCERPAISKSRDMGMFFIRWSNLIGKSLFLVGYIDVGYNEQGRCIKL